MLSRRGFIVSGAAVGGGLILAYGWSSLDDGDAAEKFAAMGEPGAPLNAWLKISPDNTITCAIHRAEMGQGVTTSLAMLLAEELDADWANIRFEFAPVDLDYYNFGMLLRGPTPRRPGRRLYGRDRYLGDSPGVSCNGHVDDDFQFEHD